MSIGKNLDYGELKRTRWNDASFPATLVKIGANTKPDFDYTDIGLLFPQNDTSEKVYINSQMQHSKKLDTGIDLHVHYIQTSADVPVFTCEFRYYNNGDDPGSFTTINTSDEGGTGALFDYVSGSILQVAEFPLIAAPTDESVSACLDLIIYRNDNVVTGDVLVKYIDYHFEVSRAGSESEWI